MRRLVPVLGLLAILSLATPSHASLTAFRSFNGKVGVSTDGFGSTSNSGTISASVPVGSTVLEAYLYTAYFNSSTGSGATLGGSAVTFGPAVNQTPTCCGLGSRRANVTSLVKPIIDAGPGGVYDFSITEASSNQDGEA